VSPRAFVTAVIVGALALGGCSRRPPAERWTAMTARAHREADRRLDAGDAAGARARLLALVDAQKAHAGESAERRLALQDTYFRLARLAIGAHEPRQAIAYADAGLAYGTAPHLFVANLLVARGAALEAAGDARAAAADYQRALVINETLLGQATELQ
jgi:tetratricopeptide (TPR) repeat protein